MKSKNASVQNNWQDNISIHMHMFIYMCTLRDSEEMANELSPSSKRWIMKYFVISRNSTSSKEKSPKINLIAQVVNIFRLYKSVLLVNNH